MISLMRSSKAIYPFLAVVLIGITAGLEVDGAFEEILVGLVGGAAIGAVLVIGWRFRHPEEGISSPSVESILLNFILAGVLMKVSHSLDSRIERGVLGAFIGVAFIIGFRRFSR